MTYNAARQIKNILVGLSKLEVSDTAGAGNLTAGSTNTVITQFDYTTFADLGYTSDGVTITFEPDLVDIKVDQLGDAAKLVEQSTKVTLKTTLAEATLQNMAVALGYASPAIVGNSTPVAAGATGNEATATGVKTLDVVAGLSNTTYSVLNMGIFTSAVPVERSLRFTGLSPAGLPRVFVCTRSISMSAIGQSYKRGEATMFPVEFRVLPDATQTGHEYGYIIDAMT